MKPQRGALHRLSDGEGETSALYFLMRSFKPRTRAIFCAMMKRLRRRLALNRRRLFISPLYHGRTPACTFERAGRIVSNCRC